MKWNKSIGIGTLAILMLLTTLMLVPYTRARIIMGGLTTLEKARAHSKFEFDIPTGMAWFSNMNWFDASEGFNDVNHTDLSLTILYSYGDFNQGTSSIFDRNSPYYSSFYGAYVIEDASFPQTLDELALVPTYDYEHLILKDLGDPEYKGAFSYEIQGTQKDVKYLDSEGWEKVDINIQTHGLWHQKDRFLNHYIQFGIPKADSGGTNFSVVDLKGRLYFKRVKPTYTVVLYIIAANSKLLEETDESLLSKAFFN
ncbi:hypothetical protein [Fusibacter ferrireducens]|uniref:Uncharacterized protein n=1 Tax=Fusibacter ferrireducens TaxID=2785058 RepID=A0ABR9ZUD9_9FIRM|nr:hypothetical protein [Fusibacter ferrireducens]MBF4693571.1 hypothetical protein [Fusibacter ferrireducens]